MRCRKCGGHAYLPPEEGGRQHKCSHCDEHGNEKTVERPLEDRVSILESQVAALVTIVEHLRANV